MAYVPYFQRLPASTKAGHPASKSPTLPREREVFFHGLPATTRSTTPMAPRLPWNRSPESKSKIRLFVRERPALPGESSEECVRIIDKQTIRVEFQYQQTSFRFDNILLPTCSQDQVFRSIQDIVFQFLAGTSATIFAYGQTGAGKTYTIIGNEQRIEDRNKKGIIPRALAEVLAYVREGEKFHDLRLGISFFQVYNEKIQDLFAYPKAGKPPGSLDIKQDKDGSFSIPGLNELIITNERQAFEYLELGLRKRSVGSTAFNTKSSRSHCVFSLQLYKTHRLNGAQSVSRLRIVDLAGSEKFKIRNDLAQGERDQHISELTSINKSLSALGQCISALADAQRTHIPFRNSKLTRVLANSLNGRSRIALFVNISGSVDSHRETVSTLMFADRAKKAILDSRFAKKQQPRGKTQSPIAGGNGGQGGEGGGGAGEGTMSLRTVIQAYCEERETRLELERFIRENNKEDIKRELASLKDQNMLLMRELSQLKGQIPRGPSPDTPPFKSPETEAHHRPAEHPVKPVSILKHSERKPGRSRSVTEQGNKRAAQAHLHEPKKSILKKTAAAVDLQYYSSNQETRKGEPPGAATAGPPPRNTLTEFFNKQNRKRVRFADRVVNQDELDDSMLERMHHNQKYNDDTIFEHMAIFQDLEPPHKKEFIRNRMNDSRKEGLVLKQRISDQEEQPQPQRQSEPQQPSPAKPINRVLDAIQDSRTKSFWQIPSPPRKYMKKPQFAVPKQVEIEMPEQEDEAKIIVNNLLRTTSLNMLPPLEELREESEYNSQPARQSQIDTPVVVERPVNPIAPTLEVGGDESGGSGEQGEERPDFNELLGDTGNEYNSNSAPFRQENTLTLGSISLEGQQVADAAFASFINSNEASIIAPLTEERAPLPPPPRQPQQQQEVMVSLTNTFSTVESLKQEVSDSLAQLAALRSGALSHIQEQQKEEPPPALRSLEEQFSEISKVQNEASEEPSFAQALEGEPEEKKMDVFFTKITSEIESLKSLVLNSSLVAAPPKPREGSTMAESVLGMISDLKDAMKSAFANQSQQHIKISHEGHANEAKIFQIVDNLADNISETLGARSGPGSAAGGGAAGGGGALKKFIAPSSTGGFH